MPITAVVRGRRRGWLIVAVSALLALAAGATVVTASAATTPPTRWSFFTGTDTSRATPDPDDRPVELGLRFTSAVAGGIEAVRFLRAPGDSAPHRVSVWAGGTRVASATSTGAAGAGWQQVALPRPVRVTPGQTYTVSYHTSRYVATTDALTAPLTAGPLTAPASAGVYSYAADGYPDRRYRSSNYWVDVVFATETGASPAPTAPSGSPGGPTPPPTGGPSASPTGPPSGAPGLPRIPWEGGPEYYGRWAATRPWNDPGFFPIGVWLESVLEPGDVARDKAAGLNTYVGLTANSNAALVRAAGGMYALAGGVPGTGSETVGNLLTDEADMIYGAGADRWNGTEGWNTCIPTQDKGGRCGYTVMQTLSDRTPNDGRPRYANYGKGVQMWESEAQAQVFVNRYQQAVSSDMYFYTDPNLCPGEAQQWLGIAPDRCRRSANYGRLIDRLRALDAVDGSRLPVYGFVEVGHPASENNAPTITPDQIAGAVWNSLIHEARGIIYFNHSFGGPCQSQHLLRDACGAAARPKVTETNQRIAALAPALNTQSYQWSANPAMDTMLKEYQGAYYLFAMPGRDGGTGSQPLTLPTGVAGGSAEVMFENRAVPVTGGHFTDTFAAEYSYHIYRITP